MVILYLPMYLEATYICLFNHRFCAALSKNLEIEKQMTGSAATRSGDSEQARAMKRYTENHSLITYFWRLSDS